MKLKDKLVQRIAEIVSAFYSGRIYRAICFYKRCLYGAMLKRKVCSLGEIKYGSNVFDVRVQGGQYITIGNLFTCRRGLRLEAIDEYYDQKFSPKIIIGSNVDVGTDCHIGSIHEIRIGSGTLMGSKVYITDHSHGKISSDEQMIMPCKRKLYSKGNVFIGNNVWIGDNVVILPGVIIGDGVIIGANSVVTKNIPENCVAAGVPAKVLKKL